MSADAVEAYHSSRQRAVLCSVMIVAAFGLGACSDPVTIEQPIQFSHKKHIEQEIECADCHRNFETATFSGLPTTEMCMDCHEDDSSDDPEMLKLLAFAAEDRNVPWQRVYEVADHVFYSHRRHVVAAELACTDCHGAIAETTVPPARPLVDQTMDWCLQCHEESGASSDCIHCHR